MNNPAPEGEDAALRDLDSMTEEGPEAPTSRIPRVGHPSLALRILIWFVPNLTAFIASFCIMVLELVAGRVLARYLGQSLYTWTSVIGIVLAGITLGNLLGGRLADWFRPAAVLAVLFLLASGACLAIPTVNQWVYGDGSAWHRKPEELSWFVWALHRMSGAPMDGEQATIPWSARIFGHVLLVFLLPSTLLGTIGPVVAKMALDQGRKIGRTVGNVYAWGALGSIAGTFLTGFYLIAKLGTDAVILSVGVVLGLVGLIYLLGRLWSAGSPQAALISFLCIFYAAFAPLTGAVLFCYDIKLHPEEAFFKKLSLKSKPWPFEWVERGGRMVLREKPKPDSNTYYLDESQYSYIEVSRAPDEETDVGSEVRKLILDNLSHSYLVPADPTNLRYDYEDIYKAITHRFAPAAPEALAALFIGGGGYIFPRYLKAKWPDCSIEVAEIDPAVTAADMAEFDLKAEQVQIVRSRADLEREGNPIWIHHLDARNHVEDLVSRKEAGQPVREFDFVYGDAFNDYAVPFHLTTKEFNDKVKKLLKPERGIYMINIIDIFHPDEDDSFHRGLFLGAVYNTFRETFGENVYVLCCNVGGPSKNRDTYIVVGALRPLDLSGLPGNEDISRFSGSVLEPEHLKALTDDRHAGALVLTDDYAPVENLLQNVVNRH